MGQRVGYWGRVLTAGLIAQACGCSSTAPSSDPEPIPHGEEQLPPKEQPSLELEAPQAPPQDSNEQPPLEPEAPQAPPQDSKEPLSCAAINPIQAGPGQTITVRGNSRNPGYYYAECGPGTSDGAGYLALMNSGNMGATLWSLVTPAGVPTSSIIGGGDLTRSIHPQPSGFQVAIRAESPSGLLLFSHSSQGESLNRVKLTDDTNEPYHMFFSPQGGSLLVTWEPREGNAQAVMYQYLDSTGASLSERIELLSAPWAGGVPLIGGVDTRGRALLMWQEPGYGDLWVAQWVSRDEGPLTRPFRLLIPDPRGTLRPLAGGGLALRNRAGQWVARFPSGESSMEPAPEWLANHPGTELVLTHGQQANALVPPPSELPGLGCQTSLLTFSRDGTACGELLFPAVEGRCDNRELSIGLDGSVIQQLDPIEGQRCEPSQECTPGENNDDRCVWRWWPRLLH